MDFNRAVKIADDIYWIGTYLENDPFQCHPYLIKNGSESILIDPGSMIEFEDVVKKIEEVVSLKDIKYIVLHHQDPDLAASISEMEKIIDREDLLVVTHSRMTVLIKHYLVKSNYYEIDKHNLKLVTDNGLELRFLTTPYCHSPGAFVTYEPKSKVLFSGDIFGGLEESWEFYAKDDYFEKLKDFHSSYMPSKDILNYALRKIEKLDINLIAPQHGSIIERRYVYNLIEKMKNLECGLYIDEKYNKELTDIINQLKLKEKELSEYKDHLEEKIKEKTFFLQEANYQLELERERLSKFNRYLSELNSVDVSFLANSATKQILDITNSQLAIFYIVKEGKLEILSKFSLDETLLNSSVFTPSNGGIVKKAYESGEWIYIDDISEEIALTIDLGVYRAKLRYIKAIPLQFHDKKIGVILIASISNMLFNESYLKGYINTLVQSLNNAITFVEVQKQSLELQNINNQLEESNRLKSEFLANVSHELRTPLNSIIGFSNILLKNKKNNLDSKQLERLEKINKNGLHLLDLINSILDLSKIEAGKMDVEIRKVDIIGCTKEVVNLLTPQALNGAKKLIFENKTSKKQIFVDTDEQKYKQIIINLISNAIKFVENGIGEVKVSIFKEDSFLKVDVSDNGIGIEKDKLDLIFEAFRQADGSTTRKYGGTGLGLTISKNLIELLGGYIDVTSEVGEGSTFSIYLPFKKDVNLDQEPILQDLKIKIKSFGEINSILAIDDTKDTIDLLKEYLNDIGCKVYGTTSAIEGLKMAKELQPSLITLDIMMPEMNGWEVLKQLKIFKETSQIPVVLISNISDKRKAAELGAIDSIVKPFSKDDIELLIRKYFKQNSEISNALVVDDEKDVRDLIIEYIQNHVRNIKEASDGKEALSIIEQGFIPDIIYLDLMMPNMSGFEFLEVYKMDRRLKDTKVIVITAKELTEEDKKILSNSNAIVISKGSNLESIIEELTR